MIIRYLVSKNADVKRYSGGSDQRLFNTREGAEKRIKKVKKLTGKTYHISKIGVKENK